MWFIRAGLAPPTLPLRKLAATLKEFSFTEENQIFHAYISRVRDAFAEIIKGMNCKQISHALSTFWPTGKTAQENLLGVTAFCLTSTSSSENVYDRVHTGCKDVF